MDKVPSLFPGYTMVTPPYSDDINEYAEIFEDPFIFIPVATTVPTLSRNSPSFANNDRQLLESRRLNWERMYKNYTPPRLVECAGARSAEDKEKSDRMKRRFQETNKGISLSEGRKHARFETVPGKQAEPDLVLSHEQPFLERFVGWKKWRQAKSTAYSVDCSIGVEGDSAYIELFDFQC